MASKELIHKFAHSTEAISDEELAELQAYYHRLHIALTPCPPEYLLTLHDAYRKIDRLKDMAAARERGRKWVAYDAVKPQGQQISVRA